MLPLFQKKLEFFRDSAMLSKSSCRVICVFFLLFGPEFRNFFILTESSPATDPFVLMKHFYN